MTVRSAACRTRRLAVATLLALVAAAHLLLLAGAVERPASGPRVAALVVRRIVADAPAVPAEDPPAAALPAPARARGHTGGPAQAVTATAPGAAALAIAAAPPPLYPVRLPPAFSGRWRREGGGRDGEFVLDWSPGDGSYRLVLADGAGDGWASRGALGIHGLEPERLVERRRGRDRRAANFRRDVGRISYSGLEQQHALLPGAQDRLSWLAQLAAVVAAAPQRFTPGAAVELFVAGTRGDAALRRFEVVALEALELPAGPVPAALRLASAAPAPYEPKLEVWLDPARGWLPVRWRSEVAATGTVVEQRLLGPAAVTSAGP